MQLVSRESVKYLMEIASINPSKEKGQNFLVEPEICAKIVNLAKINANSRIIEVGPGLGSLTYHLENKTSNLIVIDVDERVVNYLSNEVKETTNIIFGDALKYDFSNYDIVISNLPYSITKDLKENTDNLPPEFASFLKKKIIKRKKNKNKKYYKLMYIQLIDKLNNIINNNSNKKK